MYPNHELQIKKIYFKPRPKKPTKCVTAIPYFLLKARHILKGELQMSIKTPFRKKPLAKFLRKYFIFEVVENNFFPELIPNKDGRKNINFWKQENKYSLVARRGEI